MIYDIILNTIVKIFFILKSTSQLTKSFLFGRFINLEKNEKHSVLSNQPHPFLLRSTPISLKDLVLHPNLSVNYDFESLIFYLIYN